MIQVTNVVDAIYGLVGWRDDMTDAGISLSGSTLPNSDTGLYFNDAHPLLTLRNLRSIAPNFEQIDSEESANQRFCEWLETKTRSSIANAVNRFIFGSMPSGGSKTLLEHRLLYNSVGRLADTIKNSGRLVGIEIHPLHSYDAAMRIERVGMQAYNKGGETKSFDILVADSNDILNVRSVQVEGIGSYKVSWAKMSEPVFVNLDGGHVVYVYYLQDELKAGQDFDYEAVNRTIDWSKPPCQPCNTADYNAYIAWSRYVEVSPFYVSSDSVLDVDGKPLFDQQSMVYTNNTNFGLNLEVSVYCDYTDFLVRNKHEFVQLIIKQLAVDMIKEFAYNANVRANRNSVNMSRTDVVFALDGSNEKIGLIAELDEMYKGLNISMKGLDKVCRPCCNKGIRFSVT